ncbi:MAG: DUF3320 domain-containing protein, partial [Acidobacteriota bacterium]|nr:DUF3320 domain-containing protein [Acidobacteriota bacterium]
ERRAGILEIAKLGEQMQLDRSEFHSLLLPSAWEAETSELREISAGLRSGGWWRRLSPRWHHAKRQIAALCATASPGKQGELLKLIDVLIVGRHTQSELDAHGPEVSELIGSAWRGSRTDFALLGNQLDWITEAQIAVREQKAYAWCLAAARAIQDQPAILDLVGEVERFTRAMSVEISRWLKLADYDPACALVADLRHQTLGEQANCFSSLASSLNSLPLLIAYNQSAFECRESGLADLVDAVERYSCSSEAVVPLFEKARLNPLLELAFEQRPALREFDGMRQHQTVDEFRRLDEMQMLFHRALVAARHSASVPSLSAAGQTGVLAKEFERKARFLPLRKLMAKAGNAVQAIKPVFMMSPLSIANYLPPGAVEFDIAIFDEASQVKPADALGAIVRSKQVVVVGDSKQLPPTTFFDAMLDDGDKDDETEETATDDIESVLGLFSSRGAPQRMLRWHYRSRHESLIAVSNRLFYDSRLVVFPSPEQDRRDLGLVFRHLPNAYYDRGGKRTNPSEAKVVAQAVFDHARRQLALGRSERESLGVAAFSVAQMGAIEEEIEVLRRRSPELEEFFAPSENEEFFVKNLERVQGDERDVILISVGYGRTADGYLAMSFGPLNRAGGERRLNVLISRARKRCVVSSNLTADDIDLGRAPAEGVRALKTFLSYAQTGRLDIPTATGRGADSEFEEEVQMALSRGGYQVETQVGCSGFFIDLAIVDPTRPGRYILGIECDGAAYHRARSARDRDRLRQAVLEGLGWTIYRIWSTDWFRNPEIQLNRLVAAIEKARNATPHRSQNMKEEPSFSYEPPASDGMGSRPVLSQVSAYKLAKVDVPQGLDLHLVPKQCLADWLVAITNVESPIHWEEAARRITAAAGVHRLGSD